MKNFKFPWFEQIDIFGIPPLFTIRGKATFQTHIGSVLTFICFVLIIIYFSFFLNQMISHKSPYLNTSIIYDESPPEINLKKDNFIFVFGLQNQEYVNYIDESIYHVKGFQTKLTLKENGIYNYENIPLDIIKCNEYEIIPDNFKNLPLNNLYCINNDINLKGEYMNENWNYIRLNFSKCENSTKCRSEEEINELLIGGYLGIFIPDYSFDPNNYSKSYKQYVKNLYGAFSIKYFEDIFLYFKLVEVTTDKGYLFEDKKKINFVSYDYSQNEIDFRESDHFLSLTIRVSSKKETYKRSYIKLQTIFSNVGGMLKIILLIGEYSLYFVRITLYKNYILEFFNLDESAIRLKEIRRIYNLPGNNAIKFNIENIFPNLSLRENSPFINIQKNFSNIISNNYKNFGFKVIEEKSEPEKKENTAIINMDNMKKDNTSINNMEKKNKDNLSQRNDNKNLSMQNNYLSNGGFFRQKSKSRDIQPINFVFNKNNSFLLSDINISNNKIRDNSVISSRNLSIFDRNINGNNQKKLKTNSISIPKTQLRVIKVPGFFTDFVCKKNTFFTIKQVHNNYKEIQFLLDIVHYLKLENEVNIIEKHLFTDEQRKALSYTYTFEADFDLERKGYEYMIKHEKNKLDEKTVMDTSQNNLLTGKTQRLKIPKT